MVRILKVGMLGYGTVGSGVVSEFLRNKPEDISLEKILVRDLQKKREPDFSNKTMHVEDIIENPDIDIVIELMGGYQPAKDYILRAIQNGKHVVTANKAVISEYGPEIFEQAKIHKVRIGFEGAVAGGIPIINPLFDQLSLAQITSITGILNGTTNFMLSRMSEGMDYKEALRVAQDKGLAEADPCFDVEGKDAAQKISILASLAYGTWIYPRDVYCEGITRITPIDIQYAKELGYVIKLLAIANKTEQGIDVRVHPAMVEKNHHLAKVENEFNAIHIQGKPFDEYFNVGKGAGKGPTAFSVYYDVVRISDMIQNYTVKPLQINQQDVKITDPDDILTEGYLRLYLKHVPRSVYHALGVISDKYEWNLEHIIQRKEQGIILDGAKCLPDIITHDPMSWGIIQKTLADLKQLSAEYDPFYMRIFN